MNQKNKQDETVEQKRNIMQLLEEQSSDESLKICHREAKKDGNGFYYRSVDNLLYHTEKKVYSFIKSQVTDRTCLQSKYKLYDTSYTIQVIRHRTNGTTTCAAEIS